MPLKSACRRGRRPVCIPPGIQHRRGTARKSISNRLMDVEQREPVRLQRGSITLLDRLRPGALVTSRTAAGARSAILR